MNRRQAHKRYRRNIIPDIDFSQAVSGFRRFALIFVLALLANYLTQHIVQSAMRFDTYDSDASLMAFRNCGFTPKAVAAYESRTQNGSYSDDTYLFMALDASLHDFSLITDCSDERYKELAIYYNSLNSKQKEELHTLADTYAAVYADLKYFPVAQSAAHPEYTVVYENSWMSERNYMYKRFHEGCDIMASVNQRNLYPILSVSDGTIEKIGWLTQGGYRIGIRSPHGAYFYYAHLASYAKDYEIGDTISAGECIGFMGDTGYSNIEGTTGNFDVHLHFGIYIDTLNYEEVSMNPYYVLLYLENKKIIYDF